VREPAGWRSVRVVDWQGTGSACVPLLAARPCSQHHRARPRTLGAVGMVVGSLTRWRMIESTLAATAGSCQARMEEGAGSSHDILPAAASAAGVGGGGWGRVVLECERGGGGYRACGTAGWSVHSVLQRSSEAGALTVDQHAALGVGDVVLGVLGAGLAHAALGGHLSKGRGGDVAAADGGQCRAGGAAVVARRGKALSTLSPCDPPRVGHPPHGRSARSRRSWPRRWWAPAGARRGGARGPGRPRRR
jgi:hypothetical protein